MKEFRNKHKGERVFILGTGPSLNETPLERLTDEYTISMNKINLIYGDTAWRPTYYVFYDVAHYLDELPEHRLENVTENIELGLTSFIAEPGKEYFGRRDHINYFKYDHRIGTGYDRMRCIKNKTINQIWSENICEKIYNFGSTISVAAQIASYMGFDEIYFLGTDLYQPEFVPIAIFRNHLHPVDYKFSTEKTKFANTRNYLTASCSKNKSFLNLIYYKLLAERWHNSNYVSKISESAKTHFSDEYLADREIVHREVNRKMIQIHEIIKLASEMYNFDVYNATIGGYLDIYDRVDIYDLI